MEDLIKQAAYLKGYAEGLDISPKSDEGKLIMKLIDVVGAMADKINELEDRIMDVEDVTDELDETLFSMADDLYGDDYDDSDYADDDYGDSEYDDELDEDGGDYFEIECPNCGEDVMIDFDMIDDDSAIVCPNCHEEIELEFNIGSDEDEDE